MPRTTFATDDLRAALEAGVIDTPTHQNLETFLAERASGRDAPRFDIVNVLWYMGALIVISAMSLFSTTAFGLWARRR